VERRTALSAPKPRGRKNMLHTYTNLLTHVIFSTKDRERLITAALHEDLLAYDERYIWS